MRGDDRRLHVARGAVDVPVDTEGQLNIRGSHAARGGHVIDVGYGAQMPLQRRGHGAGHDLGAGARQLRRDEDRGDVDARQRRDRQQLKATAPAQRHAGRQQDGGHRPADERRGDVHGAGSRRHGSAGRAPLRRRTPDARGDAVERQVDHRRREQGQHLAHQQAADDADAERMAQLRSRAGAEHQRQGAEDRRHGGHQDRPEAQQAGLVDGLARRHALVALGVDREVDHQDRVLLHDADQQDDADQRDDRQVVPGQHQRQQRADAGRGQRREDRDRVDEALVQHAEHDVHDQHRRQQQQQFVGQVVAEGQRRALEGGADAGRHARVAARPSRWRRRRRRARRRAPG